MEEFRILKRRSAPFICKKKKKKMPTMPYLELGAGAGSPLGGGASRSALGHRAEGFA